MPTSNLPSPKFGDSLPAESLDCVSAQQSVAPSMANSVSPSTAGNDHHSCYASSIAHIPLTTYSISSQPACAQFLAHDATEPTNSIFTYPESFTNFRNLHPPLQSTTNALDTMHDMKTPLQHDLTSIQNSCLQSQSLIPNPLLSDSTREDLCMSIDEHFLEDTTIPSPNLPLYHIPCSGIQVPRLTVPLDWTILGRTLVQSRGNPVNDSLLEENSFPVSNVPGDRQLLEGGSAQRPIIPIEEPTPGSNSISRRDSPLLQASRNGVSQQHQYGLARQGFISPSLTNVNEGVHNAQGVRTLHCSASHINAGGTVDSDSQLAKMQITASLRVPDETNAGEIQETQNNYELLSPSAFERERFGPDSSPSSQVPYFPETVVSSHQPYVSAVAANLHSFSLSGQKHTGGERNILQARGSPQRLGQVHNTVVDVSSSIQDSVTDSESKITAVLQKKYLVATSFQDGQQKNALILPKVESDHPPAKRRRLDKSDGGQYDYQGCEALDQITECSSHHTRLYSDAWREEGEYNHRVSKQKDTNISHEYQSLGQESYEKSDQLQICGRNCLEASLEYKSAAKEKKPTVSLSAEKFQTQVRNTDDLPNDQGETEHEILEEQDAVDEGSGTIANQEPFITSETGTSSPSYIVRAEERKEGCMYMLLDVHRPAFCKSCDKRFPTKELLDLHASKKHARSTRRRYRKRKRQPKEYRCKVCNLRLANDANLRRHYKIVHEGKTVETCNLCKANFNSRHGLVLHLRDLHGIIPDSVQEKGGRGRNKRRYCKKEKANVVPESIWVVWKCGNCPFFSENKGNMTRHINIVHLKIADHVCDECSEVFKTKHNLQVHLMNRHPK